MYKLPLSYCPLDLTMPQKREEIEVFLIQKQALGFEYQRVSSVRIERFRMQKTMLLLTMTSKVKMVRTLMA